MKLVAKEKLCYDSAAQYIVIAIHKQEPLSFLSDVFSDSIGLLSTKRQHNENVNNFEFRFEAQLSRLNARRKGSIPESLVALVLFSNVELKDSQRCSTLAASVSNLRTNEDAKPLSKKGFWMKWGMNQWPPFFANVIERIKLALDIM